MHEPRARDTDPETSHRAAESISPLSQERLQAAILRVLRSHGAMTDEQLQAIFASENRRVTPSGVRGRRAELVEFGAVRDSGRRGKTAAGNHSIIWEAVQVKCDLFADPDEKKRLTLRAFGWHECVGLQHGVFHWRSPNRKEILTEQEAFARLDAVSSTAEDPGESGPGLRPDAEIDPKVIPGSD